MIGRLVAATAVAMLFAGCATEPREEFLAAMDRGDIERARELAEQALESDPTARFARYDVAYVYFSMADGWLRRGKEPLFLMSLVRAQDEYLTILEDGNRNQVPHMGIGMLLSMANDLDGALSSFRIACVLAPYAPCYANLARVHIFRGEFQLAWQSRHALDKREKSLRRPGLFAQTDILFAWKRGDMDGARAAFERAARIPSFPTSWRGSSIDPPLASFDDFARECCSRMECGTGMASSCRELGLSPAEVQLSDAAKAELEIQSRKRNRLLRELYREDPEVLSFLPVDPGKGRP